MGEVQDLMAVYGAIDRAVVDHPERAGDVARLLPPYGLGAAGWFEHFNDVVKSGPTSDARLPELDTALANMAGYAGSSRRQARRIMAVGALAKANPAYGVDGGQVALSVAALKPLTGTGTDAAGTDLLTLITDPAQFSGPQDWGRVVSPPGDGPPLVSAPLSLQKDPPCHSEVVTVPTTTGAQEAVALETSCCVSGVTMAQTKNYLNPANWPTCSPLWCEMTPIGQGSFGQKYREVISLDCADPKSTRITTCLEFLLSTLPDGTAVLEYQLSDTPGVGDGRIIVDEGSIVAREVNGQICVTTTKRVCFTQPFSPVQMQMFMCALGYGAAAEDVLFSCALASDPPSTAIPWLDSGAAQATAAGTAAAAESGEKDVGSMIDDWVGVASTCVDSYATELIGVAKRVQTGTYDANAMVQDISKAWARVANELAQLAIKGWGDLLDAAGCPPSSTPAARIIGSDEFTAPARAEPRKLTLAGPLRRGLGGTIPRQQVVINPDTVAAGAAGAFTLQSDVGAARAGTYIGDVVASTPKGAVDHITVYLTVP